MYFIISIKSNAQRKAEALELIQMLNQSNSNVVSIFHKPLSSNFMTANKSLFNVSNSVLNTVGKFESAGSKIQVNVNHLPQQSQKTPNHLEKPLENNIVIVFSGARNAFWYNHIFAKSMLFILQNFSDLTVIEYSYSQQENPKDLEFWQQLFYDNIADTTRKLSHIKA